MIENGVHREDCLVHLANDVEWTMPDGTFIKSMSMEKEGTFVAQHSHVYSHTSLLASGQVRVWKDGKEIADFQAPATIFIEAQCKHKFLSLTDNVVVYCIHNKHEAEIHEENSIKECV